MKKRIVGTLALASTMMLAACSNSEDVATSNVGSVTKDELYTALKQDAGSMTLQRLLLVKVLENNVDDTKALKEEADKDVLAQVEQNGGQEAFEGLLMQSGMGSIAQYKERVYLNKLITEAVKKATPFTDEEIQAAYDAWEPSITVQHILIKNDKDDAAAKQKAEDLIKQINDGADFAELAKENSEDSASAVNGGTIGPFKREEMVPEFSEAAYGLANVGDVTQEPVKTQFGYHIIKLTDKPEKGDLESVRPQLEDEMIQGKLQDSGYIHDVLSDLMQKADIKIEDKDLQDAIKEFMPVEDKDASSDKDSNSQSEEAPTEDSEAPAESSSSAE